MHDEVYIVEKNPLALSKPFDVERTNAFLLKHLFDVLCDGLVVACGSPGADEEVIGERADLAKFNDDGILCFLVECCFDSVG